MKKPSGRFNVTYASGREESLPFKTYEGKDYKELLRDLTWSRDIGSIKSFEMKLGKDK